jgi:3-oxoacyl-[acyl-carrier-protein] synthase-3
MGDQNIKTGLRVLAAGKAAPERIMTNDDLSKIVETSDEWIKTRTGMEKRHFCGEGESNTAFAAAAAKTAIERAGISSDEIGVLVVATLSADNFAPSTACLVQRELGLPDDMICFDLNAACSGFIFGLETVRGLLLQSGKKYAVLIGSEVLSKKLDMTDRGTCVLFGDGAGAVVLTLDDTRIYKSRIGCHGDDEMICCPAGEETDRKIRMDGQATYKFAVRMVPSLVREVAEKAGVELEDIDVFFFTRQMQGLSTRSQSRWDSRVTNFSQTSQNTATPPRQALPSRSVTRWSRGAWATGKKCSSPVLVPEGPGALQ